MKLDREGYRKAMLQRLRARANAEYGAGIGSRQIMALFDILVDELWWMYDEQDAHGEVMGEMDGELEDARYRVMNLEKQVRLLQDEVDELSVDVDDVRGAW